MFLHTKRELAEMQKKSLVQLIDYAGGRSHLARMLGKPLNTVNSWMRRGKISRDGLKSLEHHPNLSRVFTRKMLRPDLKADED